MDFPELFAEFVADPIAKNSSRQTLQDKVIVLSKERALTKNPKPLHMLICLIPLASASRDSGGREGANAVSADYRQVLAAQAEFDRAVEHWTTVIPFASPTLITTQLSWTLSTVLSQSIAATITFSIFVK